MFLVNNVALLDTEENNPGLLNRGGIVDLLLSITPLEIRQKSQEPGFWEVMHSFVLLAYMQVRFRRFTLLVQTEKVISTNQDSNTSRRKP